MYVGLNSSLLQVIQKTEWVFCEHTVNLTIIMIMAVQSRGRQALCFTNVSFFIFSCMRDLGGSALDFRQIFTAE